MFEELKNYEKLILKGSEDLLTDSNAYVIYIARVYLVRLAKRILELFEPYFEKKFCFDSLKYFNLLIEDKEVISKDITPLEEKHKVLKRFKRGDLKKKCEMLAIKFGFQRGVTLEAEQIEKVCNELEKEGYEVNKNSVASTLREKLRYCKDKY